MRKLLVSFAGLVLVLVVLLAPQASSGQSSDVNLALGQPVTSSDSPHALGGITP